MASLPLIDISALLNPEADPQQVQEVVATIDAACRDVGFFYITGYGIDEALISNAFDVASAFFALSEAEKLRIDITQSPNHRGYGSIGAEQLEAGIPADWKETFDMALDLPVTHPYVQKSPAFYGPNRYPDSNDFVVAMEAYYQALFPVAMRLLEAMAQGLGEASDYFTRYFTTHVSVLRMIHYPPRPSQTHENGAGAHTDYGCITLLRQDEVGGLQVKGKSGEWLAAPPIPKSFVVNIGDLMQRWTNDVYRSTAHRVMSPGSQIHRYSSPFFVEPDFDTPVSTLPGCVSKERPLQYDTVSSGEWIQSRFAATYAYKSGSSA
ncbi:isopenicillin N synthase family dioxygenase [Pokkaliibacter sp. CJK22405]|uniref:isopenicillin N synthase family dioxygenase n=1 Tax=Pokkaliibacter sp. CJK22405 TaxID=3384615 RepID=UPI003984BAD6